MNTLLKKLPLPISGLMLGAAALGNLVKDRGDIFRDAFGLISAFIFLMLVAKMIKYPKCIREGLNNPVVGGVMGTFPMGMMILSTYLKPYSSEASFGLWIAGIVIHIALIVVFSLKYLLKFNIKKVFTTYYIVYVGIVVASVSAPAHNMLKLGEGLFWFGFVSYIILLPIVLYRLFVVKEIPAPALPTIVIQSAPGSLCLAGYLSTFEVKNPTMVLILLILAAINILIALAYLPKLVVGKFFPSFSAFTFPIVISGIALKMSNGYYMKTGSPIASLRPSALVLEIIASLIVLFVIFKYMQFMAVSEENLPQTSKA